MPSMSSAKTTSLKGYKTIMMKQERSRAFWLRKSTMLTNTGIRSITIMTIFTVPSRPVRTGILPTLQTSIRKNDIYSTYWRFCITAFIFLPFRLCTYTIVLEFYNIVLTNNIIRDIILSELRYYKPTNIIFFQKGAVIWVFL